MRSGAFRHGGDTAASPGQWVLLTALAAALVALYWSTLVGLWSDWLQDPDYAHGLIVPPLVAWLIWRQRVAFRALEPRPSVAGAVIVAASLLTFLVGHAAFEFFLTRLSLVGVLAGVVVHLFGWQHLRLCLFPLLLLAIAIPLPSLIFNQIALPMQLLASRAGVAMLDVLNIPAVREGNIIVLERVTLEVAEACSGIRSLISLGTLVLVYGYLSSQSLPVRWIVALSIFPVVIVANGLRVASTGVVAHIYGAPAVTGILHSISGALFFGVAVLMLLAVERAARVIRWPGTPGSPEPMRSA